MRRGPLLVALPVVSSAVVFWRGSLDVFNTTKLAVGVGLTAIAAVTLLLRRFRSGDGHLPGGWWPGALAGFVVALSVGVAVSPTPWRSVVGLPGRHGGWLLYTAAAILALSAALVVARAENPEVARRRIVDPLLWGAAVVVAYALLQAAGADPFPWTTVEGGVPVFSTFGNVDFASAWMGVVGVLAVGAALDPARPRGWRRASAALGVASAVATIATGSLQGPLVLLGGGGLLLALVWRTRADAWTSRRTAGAVVVLVLAGVAVAVGPLQDQAAGAARSLESRLPKWQAALVMAEEDPMVGGGLDTFADRWFAARDPGFAATEGLRRTVDNAHSVPLQLLTGGGVPLLLTWLAVVVAPPLVVLRRERAVLMGNPGRLSVVLASGGYLVHALVSIDVPPLVFLGFLLSGLVVAEHPGSAMWRPAAHRLPVALARGGAVVGVGVLIGLAVLGLRPALADRAGWDAAVARAQARTGDAARATARASDLAPWEGTYEGRQGEWLAANGIVQQALVHLDEALRRDPSNLAHALNRARVLVAAGDDAAASAAYARVLEIDPWTPVVAAEAGLHLLSVGQEAAGRDLLTHAVRAAPDPDPAWVAALEGRAPPPALGEIGPPQGR